MEALLSAYVRSEYSMRATSPAHPQGRLLSLLCDAMDLDVGSARQSGSSLSQTDKKALHPLEPFTKKEAEILALMVDYASNEEIANLMHLSKDGVKYHIKNIYAKLAVSNRIQAIKIARQMGMG